MPVPFLPSPLRKSRTLAALLPTHRHLRHRDHPATAHPATTHSARTNNRPPLADSSPPHRASSEAVAPATLSRTPVLAPQTSAEARVDAAARSEGTDLDSRRKAAPDRAIP